MMIVPVAPVSKMASVESDWLTDAAMIDVLLSTSLLSTVMMLAMHPFEVSSSLSNN